MSNPGTPQAPATTGQPLSLSDAFAQGMAGAGATPPSTSTASAAPPAPQPVATPGQPPEPGAPQQPQGFFSKAWDVTKGIAAGIVRGPGQAAGELIDTGHDMAKAGLAAGDAVGSLIGPAGTGDYVGKDLSHYLITQTMNTKASAADILSSRDYLGKFGNNSVNQATANIASLVFGSEALGATGAFSSLPKLAQGAATFGTATGLLQGSDHADERLMNSLQALGVHSEFTDWLASNPTDEGALEARFKNAVDGTIGGAIGDMVFKGARYAYKVAKGAPDVGVALKEATTAADQVIPDVARPADIQTDTVSGRASSTGATLDTGEAASAAGTKANPGDVVFRVKANGTSSDAWRTVGAMDKTDLQGFYDEAAKYTGTIAPKMSDLATLDRPAVEDLAAKAPNEASVDDESVITSEAAKEVLREHQDWGSYSDSNLVDVIRRTVIERKEPDWINRVLDGNVDGRSDVVASFVRLKGATQALTDRGYDLQKLPGDLLSSLKARGWNPADASEVLGHRLEQLKAKRQAPLDITPDTAPELHQGIGQIKLSTFQSPDDVAPFMRAIMDNAPAMDRPMADVDLNKQVAIAASHMGLDKSATGAFLQNFAQEASRLPQAVGIARAQWQGIVSAVSHNAARGVDGLTDDELKYALDTVFTSRAWGAHILDIKAGLGRGLRAWQLPAINPDSYFQQFGSEEAFKAGSGVLPEGQDAAGMLPPLPRNLKELDGFYKLWNAAGDDNASRAALLQGKNIIPAPGWYARNAVANAYVGSLLAGKAIVKGFTMPAFLGAIQTVERMSGAGLMAINPMLDAASRQDAGAIAKSTAQSYFQTMGDLTSAFRYSIDATRNGGTSVIGGGYSAKDAAARTGPITQEMLDAAGKPGDLRYQIGNAINVWPRAVFSIIGGHDELTKRLSYLGRIRMQSMVYGLRNGMQGQDLEDFVRGSLQDAVDPSTQAATYPDVLNEAARTSNMNRPEGAATSTLNYLNQARRAVPELRYILPVLDVPASGLGEALRRLPGISYAFQETRDDLLGNSGTIRQAEAYGRWITGTTLLGTGYGMARSGLITGAGPEKPADKQAWMNMGFQPYSIKNPVTGNWVSYKDWEPVGTILGIMGTAFDHSVHHPEDDQTHSAVLASIAALAEYSKEKAAMQGISNLLNFGDPDTSASYFQRLGGATASGFVPAFVRYMRNASDQDLRSTKEGWWAQVLNSIPGASESLPPVRNFLGEPVHTPNDASNLYGLLPMTFASAHHTGQDPVTDELYKMYDMTGYVPPMAHPQELSHGTFDPQQVKLEDGSQMFDKFVANRMLPNPYLDGKNTHQALQDLFSSDDYKQAVYGSPSSSMNALGDPSKLRMVSQVFNIANKFSRAKMAAESDTAKKYIAVGNAKADSPDLLRTYSADDLIKTPSLFHALGIPIEDYEEKAQQGGDQE